MVLPSRGTGSDHLQGVMEYGTMLEIQSVQMLPDGRSMVETVGSHRFRLMEKGSLDGYTVGRIERWVRCGAVLFFIKPASRHLCGYIPHNVASGFRSGI